MCPAFSNADPAQRFDAARFFLGREPANQAAPHRYPVQRAGQHIDDHRQTPDQIELLKDEADAGTHSPDIGRDFPVALDHPAVDFDGAWRIGITGHQPCHMPQQGGFPGTRSADQRHHFARSNVQVNLLQGLAAVAEGFAQRVDSNGSMHGLSRC